ncbi:MAG: ATP-binding protein, partial [Gemmatimonadetes bacterium]|nr:ATP-binding protein [Gemmatimonadota bacterium]
MRSPADLATHLRPMGRVLLGYSGGIDSALLAVVASQALGPDRFLAVLGVSASLGATQYRRAIDLAAGVGVPLHERTTDELDDERYRANPLDRCYHCKRTLWQ